MKITSLFALSLSLMVCGIPTIVQAQPTPPPAETTAPKPGMAELQDAIKRDPKNPEVYYDLVYYYAKDEPDEVVKIFDRVIAIAPSNPEIYKKFALIAAEYEYKGASINAIIDRLVTAQKVFPKLPQISTYLAVVYNYSKQPDKAIGALQQGLTNGGDVKEFNLALGDIELVNKNPDRALRYYEKVVQGGGDYLCADTYFSPQITMLTAQGKAAEVLALIKSTLQKSSGESKNNCVENLYQLSDLHPPLRKETIVLIRESLPRNPSSRELINLMDLMTKAKQYTEIIQFGDKLIAEKQLLPVGTMIMIANAEKKLKNFEKAEKWYLEAEVLSAKGRMPKSATAAESYPRLLSNVRWHIGNFRLAQGKTDEAIEQFKLALTAHPTAVTIGEDNEFVSAIVLAHNSLGKIYKSQGKFAQAEYHYKQAVQKSGLSKEKLAELGVLD